ncbi:DWNN-domain-containing protein [Neolentinus lepideus HHB14362 ss-1]|uniref:DWNN-domain-containing protein n=1 Tax=Neolentinus lepideus HHB14362 ss-1 TaxID=1314782 RepID=A0A165NTQ7_9AGAM|nr:DWNN-domain-containing protein [Neolentinus lepideus HHB14362 ss-1]
MASSVYYKFKSQKNESRVTFDGTGISVFDLKKEIILQNNLGKANDFDLFVYDTSTGDEYKDDGQIIQRSSSVIVKRLPSSRPGKGKAAMYLAGVAGSAPASDALAKSSSILSGNSSWHKGSISKRFDGKEEEKPVVPRASQVAIKTNNITKDDEAAAMAAMFQAQTQNWEETQEKMSHATRVYNNSRGTGFNRGGKPHHMQSHQPERSLPPSYVCYRCGKKGHWIQDCPTNNDRDFDNKPRIKRTTGIPRSFLKAVEGPTAGGQGVMVTPEGGYVIAQPDVASWQKQVTHRRGLTEADVRERTPTDPSLVCPIDNKLYRDAVKTPCCGKLYCEECIQTHLLERDFVCPNCGKKIPSLDKLLMDKPMRTRVADYIDKAIEESKKDTSEEGLISLAGPSSVAEQAIANAEAAALEQDVYSQQQPGGGMDMTQYIDSLQAQIKQLTAILNNSALPNDVRQQTQMKYQELQMQLQEAHTFAAALAAATSIQQQLQSTGGALPMPGFPQNDFSSGWSAPYPAQQPPTQDGAYQRLPINNRRRNLKRDRPSDFLEVAGNEDPEAKVPRYWE